MKTSSFSTLRWVSLFLILAAVSVAALQLVRFSRFRANFPAGMEIAEIPVGGLDRAASAQRLLEVYSATPVELHYGEEIIHLPPASAEFELDLEAMLAAADLSRSQTAVLDRVLKLPLGAHRCSGFHPPDRLHL